MIQSRREPEPATDRSLAGESPAPADAEAILADLAAALFPAGQGELDQVTWERKPAPALPRPSTAPRSPLARRHRRKARLETAELRYQTLVEQIPAVTFMAVLGEGENEVYVSPHIEALLGFTQQEWLEDPFLWYTQLHPDDRPLWLAEFARGCRTGGPFRAECRFLARDGRIVWVRGEARLIKDEHGRPLFLQGVAFDITESKHAQERIVRQAVRRTEERYRDIVERLGAIFWEAEAPTGRFSFVSRGTETVLGYSPEQWRADAEFWISRVHPEDRERVREEWRAALTQGVDREFSFRATAADERTLWLQTTVHFPEGDAGATRPLGFILDITERKRVEEQLARSLASEAQARAEAEALNRVKDEFLATMSHELRTPVNAVLGWCTLLEMGAGDDETRGRAFSAIKRNAQAQMQIIEDLLDISRVVAGKLRLTIQPVDLVSIIEAALETVKHAVDSKRIELLPAFSKASVVLPGDADRLRQVVTNLLTNAVKFTPEGGRIEVRVEVAEHRARIRVTDTGEGIDPEFLPYVFDRFRQADSSYTRPQGGLGLGLAIVRHLTELHGGRVSAESRGPGLGASFTVELPLDGAERDHAADGDPAATTAPTDPLASLADARILVVDDNPDSVEIMAQLLERAGARVSSATSAAAALRLLRRRTFDLLVCDVGMPGQSGLDLIRELRTGDGPNRNIPAAAVTAYARENDRRRALAAGFQEHLAKPLDMSRALAALRQLLDRTRRGAGPGSASTENSR